MKFLLKVSYSTSRKTRTSSRIERTRLESRDETSVCIFRPLQTSQISCMHHNSMMHELQITNESNHSTPNLRSVMLSIITRRRRYKKVRLKRLRNLRQCYATAIKLFSCCVNGRNRLLSKTDEVPIKLNVKQNSI